MTDASREWLLSPALLALLGLVVGSFLNVVIHRLPRMMLRQWWADTAGQLGDEEGHARCSAARARRCWRKPPGTWPLPTHH